jgi:tetratricopeptide (TPR) repeat protein/transcriptional regulator with XRE-family HTH domain
MGASRRELGGPDGLLRAHRLKAELTQEQVAELSGLSVRTISDIECGRTSHPRRSSVALLEAALGVTGLAPAPWREHGSSAGQDDHAPPAAVPRQLPRAVPGFVGRSNELTAMTELILAPETERAGATVCAIAGTAGVGKTELAVQWAHLVAARFPDGQLYLNLRGYDPDQPVAPADALAVFLRTLGVPGQVIPDAMEERALLYRSKLADRRMLVLLDNARDGDQIRPLLPGDPGCVAVVTSRDTLAGLVATGGVRRLDLDLLPLADAVALLRSLIGPRADQDPEATTALAGLCARLPLALRVAAEMAAVRPAATLRDVVAELAGSRLDCLEAGEDRADVRAVFSWSYRQLPDDVAGAFALFGLHPGADLDLDAAAALTGTTAGHARRVLGRLYRASLVQASGPGRYGMHDLLRSYACEQAAACDTHGQCHQALTRLFDYYLTAAAAAMDVLFPAEAHQRPRVPASSVAGPALPGEADARAWLDRERANLVAVAAHCAHHGRPRHAADLAGTLFRYLVNGSHVHEAHTIYGHALQAARRSCDLAAEAEALRGLGCIGVLKGHHPDAVGPFRAALERYRQCGDRAGQARVLHNLGVIEAHLHNSRSAAGYHVEAMDAYQDAGDRLGVARALSELAAAETDLGSYDEAAEHLRRSLPVLRDAKDRLCEAIALSRIGELNVCRGQLTQAADFFEQALAIQRCLDHRTGVADQLLNLGQVSLRQGNYRQGIDRLRQALARYRETGQQEGEILALRGLAEAMHGVGQPATALAELETALQVAAEVGNTYQQASVHRDLGESYRRAGRDDQASHHWQQALTLYTHLGAPEADQVRSRLSAEGRKQRT